MTTRVAVRGGDEDVEAAVSAAGASLVAETGAADAVVAVGEAAIRSVVTDSPERPVLAVTPEGGGQVVARRSLDRALSALVAGTVQRASNPVLEVRLDGDPVSRVAFDVTLMTTEPATISEYAVRADGDAVDSFRADGVVASTPLGSAGYAAAAGGPVLAPGTGVSVVPVAPFSTRTTVRVVDPNRGLGLSVEREGDVSLFADGVRRAPVGVDADLRVARVADVDVVRPIG